MQWHTLGLIALVLLIIIICIIFLACFRYHTTKNSQITTSKIPTAQTLAVINDTENVQQITIDTSDERAKQIVIQPFQTEFIVATLKGSITYQPTKTEVYTVPLKDAVKNKHSFVLSKHHIHYDSQAVTSTKIENNTESLLFLLVEEDNDMYTLTVLPMTSISGPTLYLDALQSHAPFIRLHAVENTRVVSTYTPKQPLQRVIKWNGRDLF